MNQLKETRAIQVAMADRAVANVLATNRVIRNTYLLLAMTLAFSALTAAVSMAMNLPYPGLILTLGGYFGLLFLTTKFRNSGLGVAFVFALTGYHPDYDFLQSFGIELSTGQCRPVCDPETLESNVPGIYVAGVIVAGAMTNEIFIENGRFHGKSIAQHLKLKLGHK